MELKQNDQLYVNGKWYMDIIKIEDTIITIRIKYYETDKKDYYLYKNIKLSTTLFSDFNLKNTIITCKINEVLLKKQIGSLIYRLVKESDITSLFEDVAGMGAVSNPGLSGTPGIPGSAGSDISNTSMPASVMPGNSFGLEIDTPLNKKVRKKLKTKVGKSIIKSPIINLYKESVEFVDNRKRELVLPDNVDINYKNTLYTFLDYPAEIDYDINFINTINAHRAEFLSMSMDRIKLYFQDLYKLNKSIITKKCSDWFNNNIIILANIKE